MMNFDLSSGDNGARKQDIVDKTIENPTIENKTNENKTIQNQTVESKTIENRTMENKSIKKQIIDSKTINHRTTKDNSITRNLYLQKSPNTLFIPWDNDTKDMSEDDKREFDRLREDIFRNPSNPAQENALWDFCNTKSIEILLEKTANWDWRNIDKLNSHLKNDRQDVQICKNALIFYTDWYEKLRDNSKTESTEVWKNPIGEALMELRESYFFDKPQILEKVRDIITNTESIWFEPTHILDIKDMSNSGAC